MKIHADKIEKPPPHSLSLQAVRLIMTSVPQEWLEGIKEVRLSNSLEFYSADAYVRRYSGIFYIYCRRGTKREALDAMLLKLAANGLGLRGYRRTKAENQHVNCLIQPLVDKLFPVIAPSVRNSHQDLRPMPLDDLYLPQSEERALKAACDLLTALRHDLEYPVNKVPVERRHVDDAEPPSVNPGHGDIGRNFWEFYFKYIRPASATDDPAGVRVFVDGMTGAAALFGS